VVGEAVAVGGPVGVNVGEGVGGSVGVMVGTCDGTSVGVTVTASGAVVVYDARKPSAVTDTSVSNVRNILPLAALIAFGRAVPCRLARSGEFIESPSYTLRWS